MLQSLEILNLFNVLTLKKVLWSFEKLEYRFLVGRATIESTIVPYTTDLSKANVKTNRTGSTKWTYYKEHSFATNYLNF